MCVCLRSPLPVKLAELIIAKTKEEKSEKPDQQERSNNTINRLKIDILDDKCVNE